MPYKNFIGSFRTYHSLVISILLQSTFIFVAGCSNAKKDKVDEIDKLNQVLLKHQISSDDDFYQTLLDYHNQESKHGERGELFARLSKTLSFRQVKGTVFSSKDIMMILGKPDMVNDSGKSKGIINWTYLYSPKNGNDGFVACVFEFGKLKNLGVVPKSLPKKRTGP